MDDRCIMASDASSPVMQMAVVKPAVYQIKVEGVNKVRAFKRDGLGMPWNEIQGSPWHTVNEARQAIRAHAQNARAERQFEPRTYLYTEDQASKYE